MATGDIALPTDTGLRFGTSNSPDHQLTVWNANGDITVYMGSISGDGQSLAFSDVDLGIPDDQSQSVMWVCVSASNATPVGATSVDFRIGIHTSPSTTIHIIR